MQFHNYTERLQSAKLEVNNLISQSKPTLPVDIYYIVKLLDYSVEEANIPWPGYLPEGRNVIVVRKTDPSVRKRFTIAHEIGHILWGKVSQEDPIASRTRNKNVSTAEEKIADQLAAELLMPMKEFQGELSKANKPSLYDVITIARLFGVSIDACMLRIAEIPGFLAFSFIYNMNMSESGVYDISFSHGYTSKPRLTFTVPPLGVINDCIQYILKSHTAWEGNLRFKREEQEFQIPSIGSVVVRNQQHSIRLLGWKRLNNQFDY